MKIIVFYLEINVLSQRYVLILCTVFVEIFFQPIYLNIQSNHCVMKAIHWHFVVSVKLLEFWFLRSRLMLPHNHKTILTRAIFSCRRIEREIDRERGVRRPLETMRAILIMKDRCPKPRLIFGRSRAAVWELQRNLGVGLLCCLKKCSSWLGLSHVPI